MGRNQDYLPEAERFAAQSKEDAVLIFGSTNPLVYQEPTGSLPGSLERIEIYRERAARRQPIFNPNDRNDMHGGDLMSKAGRPRVDPIKEILRNLQRR